MIRADFVRALKSQTSDAAFFCTRQHLEKPPGRKPREQDVKLSSWYLALSDSDRGFVDDAMLEAAELAVFSFLCILDGVSAVENESEKGELRLQYVRGEENINLNDAAEGFLHDAYNAVCREQRPVAPWRSEGRLYEVGHAWQLRRNQTNRDALDLHAVSPTEHTSARGSPAISLPKNEHRKL